MAAKVEGVVVRLGEVQVFCSYTDRERAKAIGAAWNAQQKCWTLPATQASVDRVLQAWRHEITAGLFFVHESAQTFEEEKAQAPRPDELNRPVPITKEAAPPWKVQREAFWWAMENFARSSPAGVALDMKMGTGKSRVIVDLIQNLPVRRVLIMVPRRAVAVWPFQLMRWGVDISRWQVCVCGDTKPWDWDEPLPKQWIFEHRTVAKRLDAAWKVLGNPRATRQIIVANYEGVWREPMGKDFLKVDWGLIVADEVHNLKAARGAASKWAAKLKNHPRRVGMSGTWMPHSPLDVFAEMRFVDPRIFGHSVTAYRASYLYRHPVIEHAVMKNPATKDHFLSAEARAEFKKRFARVTYRAEKNIKDLPPATWQMEYAELENDAAKAYAELRAELIATVRHEVQASSGAVESSVLSPNAMVLVTRLLQLCSGHAVTEDGSVVVVSRAKQKLLEELMEAIDPEEPLAVFCRFRADLDLIQEAAEAVGRSYGEISGRRKDVRGVWRRSQGISVLGAQLQAGSEGVDYTNACYTLFWNAWGGGPFVQARDRMHRPPQKKPVTLIGMCTKPIGGKEAVDARLLRALKANEQGLEALAREAIAEAEGRTHES